MTYEQAKANYETFTDAQRKPGVYLRSRGKFFPLNFSIELVEGKIAMIANVPRNQETEATKPAKPKATRK